VKDGEAAQADVARANKVERMNPAERRYADAL
jgi:hypothetical protein